MSGTLQVGGVTLATHTESPSKLTLDSGVVFPAGSIVGWEQVTTVPTAIQGADETYTNLTGSTKSYTPPTGASYVVYEYSTMITGDDSFFESLPLIKFILDGSEVSNTNHGFYQNFGHGGGSTGYKHFRFIVSAWSGEKTMSLQYRRYGSVYRQRIHQSKYSGDATNTNVYTNIYQVTYSVM